MTRLEFHGQLDAAALATLEAALATVERSGARACVVLRSGTEVDRAVLSRLRSLSASLEIESPYLARWLAREP